MYVYICIDANKPHANVENVSLVARATCVCFVYNS